MPKRRVERCGGCRACARRRARTTAAPARRCAASSCGVASRATSGSDRIASPTHDGATIRMRPRGVKEPGPRAARRRVADDARSSAPRSVPRLRRAADEPVARAAVGTERLAGRRRCRETRADDSTRAASAGSGRTPAGPWPSPRSAPVRGVLGHRHTFVSHAFFDGLRPLTVSKKSVCKRRR